jgi:hypothetical protein
MGAGNGSDHLIADWRTLVTTQLDPEDFGINEREARVLRTLLIERSREERQRVLDYVNAVDPRLQKNDD